MPQGAPQVQTNVFQQIYTSDPGTDAVAETLRSKQVVQQIPVYEPAYQFSVPERQWNMGWKSSDIPPVPGPTYAPLVQAPSVPYANKSYSGLVQRAANPISTVNRQAVQLSAPAVQTVIGS